MLAVIEELNRVGLKATTPRLRVLEVFHSDSRRHLSAEDVYKRLAERDSDIGLGTVYRVLGQLTDVGVLVRSVFDPESGKAVYELHNGESHDHLVCLDCGRVDEFVDEVIDSQQRVVAQRNGYSLAPHNLALYGYCAECRSRA